MRTKHQADWLTWLLGTAALATVIGAVLHFSEVEALVALTRTAAPQWLMLAIGLQAATYLVEGGIWYRVGRAAGFPIDIGTAFRFSLVKLFTDQAIPSAGLSGNFVVAHALARMGMPKKAITAGVVVRIASYYAAYVVSLGVALWIVVARAHANSLIVAVSVFFAGFAVLSCIGLLALSGHPVSRRTRALTRYAHLQRGIELLQESDTRLVHNRALQVQAMLLQLGIVLLDAATVWVLVRALGLSTSPVDVFASFMLSTVFRSIGILPGGLGSFEAVSVLTLNVVGIPIEVALAVTLMFRGLSFWLPMLPGFWYSRQLTASDRRAGPRPEIAEYWAIDTDTLMQRLAASPQGLTSAEATDRLRHHGRNSLRQQRSLSRLQVLLNQLRNPLLLVLILASIIATVVGEWSDAVIVVIVVVASVGIGYMREYSAQSAAAALRARIQSRANVLRDGTRTAIPTEEVVPGDIVLLAAGSLVPADAVIIEASDCYVSEAVLTGESFPVPKRPGPVEAATPLPQRSNCAFLGTNVRSGVARCLVVATGTATEFGSIAERLSLRPPDTEFDRGLLRFGYLLTTAMLVMVILVCLAHVLQGRPAVETLLFAVALAVGLSPELLPAILSVNLARGAEMMSKGGVLVRHLNAIENLGSMDVLCTDKTGTITEGVVKLEGAYDEFGRPQTAVLAMAAINAALESGLNNPLDEAIEKAGSPDLTGVRKLAEIPFDFTRKRVSVVIERNGTIELIAKGALHHVLEVCTRHSDGTPLDQEGRERIEGLYSDWSSEGVRVLAVATRPMDAQPAYGRDDECDLRFAGFLTFLDRPKEGVGATINALRQLGVAVKVISGDSRLVTQHVAKLIGMQSDRVLTGADLDALHDEALWHAAERTDLFVEVDPNQKERIILALKKMGHVVGFLGDGVNDAPAMHAADTSLSVEEATDVAREAADFVLLERDLEVIRRGVIEGRRTFANTLKYVLITTSANLGNMVSMAAVSLFLPFLPLLAGQILLNNMLSDIPAIGIADDSVDHELIDRPRRWDMGFIGRYMVEFGVLSSLFDLLTFIALIQLFHAAPDMFRTGWFVESLLTELVIALVVRTRRPFYRSRPGTLLMASTAILIVLTFAIPYLPYANLLGFVPLPGELLLSLAAIAVVYVAAAELTKRWFYRGVD